MNTLRRIYVEKKFKFNDEAHSLLNSLNHDLKLDLQKLRIVNRYDISGISDETLTVGIETILKEPMVDDAYHEELDTNGYSVFAIEYLPGQYDQRADSCEQCFMILEPKHQAKVKFAKVYLIDECSTEILEKIQAYLINPVDQRLASLNKPETLEENVIDVKLVPIIEGFTKFTKEDLETYLKDNGMAMSIDDLLVTQAYYKEEENRDPSETELKVLDTYWSDHCRHTTFSTIITDINIDDGPFSEVLKNELNEYEKNRHVVYGIETKRPITLMDMAVIAMKKLRKLGMLQDLEVSEEINACSIEINVKMEDSEEVYLLMFKNETHNHPTEIEPFGGAATCLGGAIRDPLSGRSYVYQSMRITGASDPLKPLEETIKGKLPQSKICKEAAHGFSSYGNQIGLATGYVKEIYHEGYAAKRMELGAVIAAAPKRQVQRGTPKANDIVLLIGGRTGRDGIGGATGSSKSHDVTSIETSGAEVQKGNPIEERKIQRLFRDETVASKIVRCNDFGAGGVCVAVGELAPGLTITLDNVLKKYEGLNGTELAISESQERMAIVIEPKDEAYIIQKCYEENLEVVNVATITADNRLVMHFKGQKIVDISRDFLDASGAKRYQEIKVALPDFNNDVFVGSTNENFKEVLKDTLSNLNVTSQKGLVEMFDSSIGNNTVISPFGGKTLRTESEGMCALIPVLNNETTTSSLMTYGFNADISKWSPYHGANYAVIESLSKIVAMGGDYRKVHFSFQEYYEKLLNDPYKWGKPFASLLGANKVLNALNLAAIGGKDSMSGTFMDLEVPPTLVSFAVTTSEVDKIITPELKETNTILVEVTLKKDEYQLIDLNNLQKQWIEIMLLNDKKAIYSAYTIKNGGILEAIAKMAFGNNIGVSLNNELTISELTMKNYGHIIIEVNKDTDLSVFDNYRIIGETNPNSTINYQDNIVALDEAYQMHTQTLEGIYPTICEEVAYTYSNHQAVNYKPCTTKVEAPLVVIPVFPGTNCEYDSIRVFEKAGAKVELVIIKNKTAKMIQESIEELKDALSRANILMLAGGFSAGDEPEGSGKYIATFLRNDALKNEIETLLNKRDGLIIGICNGFQALVKLGLLPYGEIKDMDENDPTLTFNKIKRHQAKIVKTRIGSVNSPWLSNVSINDEFMTPISHGEGRFVCNDDVLEDLMKNGQVFSQYVDDNPNGSINCIEGIISKDGKILGKMAHSERVGKNRMKNIYGPTDQRLFASAVEYFKGGK